MAILAAGRKIAPRAVLGNLAALAAGLLVMLAPGRGRAASRRSRPRLLLGAGAVPAEPRPAHPLRAAPRLRRLQRGHDRHDQQPGAPRARVVARRSRPDTRRVLFLGDSVTFGPGVRDDEPFARQVEAMLRSNGAAARSRRSTPASSATTRSRSLARLDSVGLRLPARRRGSDLRRQRPARDVLDLRPPVRADRHPGRGQGLAPPQQQPVPLRRRTSTGASPRRPVARATAKPSRSESATAWRSDWPPSTRSCGAPARTARASCWCSTPTTSTTRSAPGRPASA